MTTKKEIRTLVFTTLICLFPLILSAVFYKQLPDQIAIHFDKNGDPNNYAPKALAAWGLPLFIAVINILVQFGLNTDPKKSSVSPVFRTISKWVCPIVGLVVVPSTLLMALGIPFSVEIVVPVLVGIIFILCGNYLPKSRQNYTVGIKIPWTLHSEDNWNKTHRLAGYLYILGGIIMILAAFLKLQVWIIISMILLMVLIPFVYSYLLYRKNY